MDKDEFKKQKRTSVSADLNRFDCLAKENDFIEVNEWTNEEGWDITIGEKQFSLTRGELKAIEFLTTLLDIRTDDLNYNEE